MPNAFRLVWLVTGSPVAGDVTEPNSDSSGSDDPAPGRESIIAMAPGTTSVPRHAATSQAARRGPGARGAVT
jgi:hypothetical protein